MALARLWAGMRTRPKDENESAGTEETIVLIINDGGDDVLHHTFPEDTDQDDLEAGQANLYEVPGADQKNIRPQNLNPSSIRLGIRGDDAWLPQDIFVFGEEGGSPIPLAWSRQITETLSTEVSDSGDGRISIPIRRVSSGSDTANIVRLLLLMETGSNGTDSRIFLRITVPGDDIFFAMPRLTPQDGSSQLQQEANQANFFYIDVEGSPIQKAAISNMTLKLEGDDDWLPARFFLFGLDRESVISPTSPATVIPLVHLPDWPFGALTESNPVITLPTSQ